MNKKHFINNIDVTIERLEKLIIKINLTIAKKEDPKGVLKEFDKFGRTLLVDLDLYLKNYPEDVSISEKKHKLNIYIIDFKLAVAEGKYRLLENLANGLLAELGDLQNDLESKLGKANRKRESIQAAVQEMKKAA